ncbi:MAG: hypothetical protein COV73_00255 [Candidatus Omnitrophica bacterium CG11_big_fil_rev_8_21_14_0_20_43_6]|nr:MAG: hypothetical protein COV73_00255 [Candidatus Omnitrophica bacterium CG11_big_fil_rev_8_21_14_0_20_43_6]
MKFVFLFSICCLLTTALTGCKTISDSRLEPQSILKFSDIPIPVGLKPLPQISYSFENTGARVAVLKYQGRANIDQVINFYKEQMPIHNWNLINIIEYGQRLLNFEREDETCIITIQVAGFWNEEALVTISLGLKSQNSTRKAKEPIK